MRQHTHKVVATMSETWQELEGKVLEEKLLLVRYLGGSGASAVFLADEIGNGGPSAIKLIPLDPQEPEAQLARLRAAERLSHPNLIRILDAGRYQAEGGEFAYIRMEYAEENLGQFLPLRRLTETEAQQLLNSLLQVLGYLHAQGFVHGHIKPSNIMAIGEQVKLSSDGLCPAGELARLDPQSVYTAPEAVGEAITPAADSWSLGVTLLEALTGSPFGWSNQEEDPAIPDTLPAPLLDVVRHCLRRDPRQRWSVAEIAARLGPKAPAPKIVAPAPVVARAQEPGSRHYGMIATIAAAVIIAILAGFALMGGRSGGDVQSAAPQQSAEAPAPAAQPGPGNAQDQPRTPEPAQPPAQEQAANQSTSPVVPLGMKEAVPQNEQDFIVHRQMPNVSRGALNTIHGTVRVRIRVGVDPSGNVASASFVSHGPSNYFAERSMQAAKQWKFTPGGQKVASEWLLRFLYRNSGATVIPEQEGR